MTNDALLAEWDDPAVQTVYRLLCETEGTPDPAEHWEGYVARRIVAALRSLRLNESVEPTELPLRCEALGGVVRIVIGANVLAFAAGQNADLWDGESDPPVVKITDAALFAEAVADAINDESETGETRLTRMLDDAICHAVENGCEGVDHGDE